MGIIAVAGGTGGVGQTIVDALVAAGTHKVIVLSRNARSSGNAISLQVDYDNVDSTAKALETENVDTVICAFGMVSDETGEMQVKLIQAASKSTSTRRFVISAFDMLHKEEHIPLNPVAKWTFDAISEIEKTDLEYTRVVNGLFLDYYGMPHWKTHLKPWVTAVNVEKKWAAIPGDGSARAHFITTQDMAKFVARLMDLDKWPPVSSIVGDTATFKEILELAENARGTKFSVAYDSLEDLQQGKISFPEFPDNDYDYGLSKEEMYAQVHYQAGIEAFLVPTDDTLNSRFPDLKTTTAAEIIESCWKGR